MNINILSLKNDDNIGLKCYVNEEIAIVPQYITDKEKQIVREALNVELITGSIAGTDFLGVFIIGKGKKILVPSIIRAKEVENLTNQGLEVVVVNEDNTCFGNNVLIINDTAILYDDAKPKFTKIIKEELNLNIKKVKFKDLETPASFIIGFDKKAIINLSDYNEKMLKKTLKLKTLKTTINSGSEFIKSGLLANNKGILIGGRTTGFEMSEIDQFAREE